MIGRELIIFFGLISSLQLHSEMKPAALSGMEMEPGSIYLELVAPFGIKPAALSRRHVVQNSRG